MLNEQLGALLRAFFVDEPRVVGSLFRDTGALGTFYARIQIATALGLISAAEHDDLDQIRQIRNHIAHFSRIEVTFEDEKLKQKSARLKPHSPKVDDLLVAMDLRVQGTSETETRLFTTCMILLFTMIYRRDHLTKHQQKPEPVMEEALRAALTEASTNSGT